MVKSLPAMWETRVWPLGWEDPLEKGMVTHSSTLTWRIPWTEDPGRLQSMGSQRVEHDWPTNTFTFTPCKILTGKIQNGFLWYWEDLCYLWILQSQFRWPKRGPKYPWHVAVRSFSEAQSLDQMEWGQQITPKTQPRSMNLWFSSPACILQEKLFAKVETILITFIYII